MATGPVRQDANPLQCHSDLPTADERYNARLFNIEAPFTSVAFSLQGFFALFAIEFGASNALVGWLTSGPALINLLWLIPCGRIVQRARTTAHPFAAGALMQRLLLIAMGAIPLLPDEYRALALVLLVTAQAVPGTLRGIAFQTASGEMFSARYFTHFVGQRWAIMSIADVAGMLLLGRLVDVIRFPLNIQVLSMGIGLLGLTTVWFVLRLRLPHHEPTSRQQAGAASVLRALVAAWRQHHAFVYFEAGVLVSSLALYSAMPLYRIYWVRDLGAAGVWVGILSASLSLGLFVSSLYLGRVSNPHTERPILLVASIGYLAAYPWLTAAFDGLAPLIGVGFVAGLAGGATELTMFNRMVRVSPAAQRPTFIAVHNIVANVAGFAGPLLSTALLGAWGSRVTLMGVGLLGMLGALLLYGLGWERSEDDVGWNQRSPLEDRA